MAISNPVTIGQNTPAAGSAASTVAVTTSVLVPAGGKIWLFVGWGATAATLSSVAGGSLTWTVDRQVANGTQHFGLAWADAPSGLASSTVITATFSAATADSRYISAAYSTGAATGVSTTGSTGTTGTTAWTSGAVVTPSGSILIGGCYGGTTSATNTASGGNTEVHDFAIASDSAMTTCYQLGTGASIASQGTWTASETNCALCSVFTDAAVTAALPELVMAPLGH